MNTDNKKRVQALLLQQIEVGLKNDTRLEGEFVSVINDVISLNHEINKDVALELEKMGAADTAIEVLKHVPDGVTVQKDTWAARMQQTAGKLAALDVTKETRVAMLDYLTIALLGDNAKELLAETTTAKKRPPLSPSPFNNNGEATVGNNPPVHVLLQATAKAGPNARRIVNGWRTNTLDYPMFRDPQRIKGDWVVHFLLQDKTPSEAWTQVEKVTALHTKVALFCLARICDPRSNARYPDGPLVGISYEDIRRATGFTRRGADLETFKLELNRVMKDLSELQATVRDIMINGKPCGIANCRMFSIEKVWHEQLDMFGNMEQVGWLVEPGIWAKHYFSQEAKPWISTLHRTLLELDHRGVRKADTLALHIATLLFTVAGGTHYQERTLTRTVADILEIAGELPEPEDRPTNWANRTREAFSAAIEILLQKKLIAAVEYGNTYPDAGDIARGWVDRWLSATIELTSPSAAEFQENTDMVTDNLVAIKRLNGAIKSRNYAEYRAARKVYKKPVLARGERFKKDTAEKIRAALTQQFPSQKAAALHFKCSQATLSKVVNGLSVPSAELAAALLALLDNLE